MSFDFQALLNSPHALRLAAGLARALPTWLGYPLCDRLGNWLAASRQARLTQVVRLHQWVARGEALAGAALDQAVRETLRNNARDIYHLYHYLERPAAVQTLVQFSPESEAIIRRPEFTDRGLVVIGLHLSNFDLVLRYSVAQLGFQPLVLTIPGPQGGRRIEFEMRRQLGMNLLPASVSALRAAVKHLEGGGTVLTGADRPIPEPKHRPVFFGRPAPLPTHYAYLAARAGVPVVVMAVIERSDGKYHVLSSEALEMKPHLDHEQELRMNASRVLAQAEAFIRQAPGQWNVPLPIWPELLVPGQLKTGA